MATKVLILGESGTGKSTSIRNLPVNKTGIIGVVKKPLPFREKGFKTFYTDSYTSITQTLTKAQSPIIVIDDVQYLLANEFMHKAHEKGYDKFTKLAVNFWNLLNHIDTLHESKTVYLLSHIERNSDGFEKIKTVGKLLDEKITIEGLFTIVLKTTVTENGYFFTTKNSGNDTVKSPMGLFEDDLVPNDLFYVDTEIRKYYNLAEVQVQ